MFTSSQLWYPFSSIQPYLSLFFSGFIIHKCLLKLKAQFQTWKYHCHLDKKLTIIGWILCFTGNNRAIARILETLRSQVPNHKQNGVQLIMFWLAIKSLHCKMATNKAKSFHMPWATCWHQHLIIYRMKMLNSRWIAGKKVYVCMLMLINQQKHKV